MEYKYFLWNTNIFYGIQIFFMEYKYYFVYKVFNKLLNILLIVI